MADKRKVKNDERLHSVQDAKRKKRAPVPGEASAEARASERAKRPPQSRERLYGVKRTSPVSQKPKKQPKDVKMKKKGKVPRHDKRPRRVPKYTPAQLRARRLVLKKRLKVIGLALMCLFALATLIFCFVHFLRVDTITVNGSKRYSDEEIISSSGIGLGDHIITDIDINTARSNIISRNPYISSVSIKRKIPQGIAIELIESDPAYYIEIAGEYFILSEQLQILERIDVSSEAQVRLYGVKKISCKKVSNAIVGRQIEFADASYTKYLLEFLKELKASEIYGKVTYISADSKFDLKISYDDRFLVSLGDRSDIDIKLLFSSEIIKTFAQDQKGTLDVRDPSKGYVEIKK